MRSFHGRVLIVLAVLGILLRGSAGLAAAGKPKGSEGPAPQVSVHGQLQLYTGALPAVWSYDSAQERMLIDVQIQENLRSWVLLDWKATPPMGFLGREDGCFSFPLRGERPSPAAFDRLLRAPSPQTAEAPDKLPEGLNSVRQGTPGERYLVLREPDAILVFKVGSIASVEHLPELGKDTSRCQPLSGLTETLTSTRVSEPSADERAAAPSSLLQYNHPYTFRGAIYGHLSYKGKTSSQTKPDYDAAFTQCKNDGPNQCKPFYETGGWFGRYGYHCGDGWGGGHDKTVSGQDYCCYLHDREVWGGQGKQAENLCGFAACMTCKYYTSLPDWEQNFHGDFWAQKAIAAYVAAGIAVVLCHPQNYLTGFTCN